MEKNTDNIKYITTEFSKPAGTPAGTLSVAINVDTRYKRCTGAYIKEITDGDLVNKYNVGLRSDKGHHLPPANKTLLEADASVAPDHKFLSLGFDVYPGMNLVVEGNFATALATDALNFLIVLRLEEPVE